ncbi:BLOC-1-related complex subunit 7 isoform X1 [Etheostoma spectabile]|uniref:BLOC-1-related complex subunit 7 isoform X1 n=1 Tax=Etheostoma spectabile TaxID=54343 RepID=UPI0013AF97C9|nr:BLOC-1-related complex subunit 7 isoform X1 [Etheostoma spectabile]
MASAESQPRFGQSVKGLLSDKVGSCSGDVIALTRQVLKGSRSQELLGQAARNMVIQEDAILHSEDAGGHPEECGALEKPPGPAETPAKVSSRGPPPHNTLRPCVNHQGLSTQQEGLMRDDRPSFLPCDTLVFRAAGTGSDALLWDARTFFY